MRCKNCGNQLKEGEKFCTLCGTYNDPNDPFVENPIKIPKNHDEKEVKEEEKTEENDDYSDINEFSFNKKLKEKNKDLGLVDEELTMNDDPYVASYIGEDYKWIVERPFNIYALLLSWIYFIYRKMYLIGTIGLFVTGLIVRFIPILTIPVIVLVMVGSGVFFNKIYLKVVEKKVNRIAAKVDSPTDAMEACHDKGGVNVWIPLLIFFIFLVFMFLTFFRIFGKPKPKYWRENSYNQANCKRISQIVYKNLDDKIKANPLESMACIVNTGTKKTYSIYIKLDAYGTSRYIYYESDQSNSGDYVLKGDTAYIKELEEREKKGGLATSDKEFLDTSKELSIKYSSFKDDSDFEDKLIFKGKDTKEKTHYVFTREEIDG